jgi:hypothetical protein
MTVGQLMKKLADADPDMPVVLDCEQRCDPHPVAGASVVRGGREDDRTYHPHVSLWADLRQDFERFTDDDTMEDEA